MQSITWLLAANVAVWLGLGGYICFLAGMQKKLTKRLQVKEMLQHD